MSLNWGVAVVIEHMYDSFMAEQTARSTQTPLVSLDARCDTVNARLATLAGSLNLINAELAAEVEALLESGLWQQGGCITPAGFLVWKLGITPHRANQIVRVAQRRSVFPQITAMFDRGELSLEQVAVAVEAPDWAEDKIIDLVPICTPAKLRRAFRSIGFEDDPDTPEPTVAPPVDTISMGIGRDGRWHINGNLAVDDGMRIEAAITEHHDAMFHEHGEPTSTAAAFVDIFDQNMAAVTSVSRRDRYRSWLHVDVTDGAATTTNGWRIPTAVRDRLLCDGVVQPVWETDGVPFSIGRAQHTVPSRTRRIIEFRDRGCRVLGCDATHVEIHHIIHWLDGGPTDTWNLISLCPIHHKMHHHGQLGITGNADTFDAVEFTDHNGRRLCGVDPPDTNHPPPDATQPYTPPLLGRFDWNWIGLGWSHPNAVERHRQQLAEHYARMHSAPHAA